MKINRISTDKADFLQITEGIDNFPKSLYLLGKLPETRKPTIAIVGTRRPTTYGREVAYKFAYDLASKGVVIVSGLALGIDGIVHKAAIDAGGTTIAVMPCGLDQICPRSHRDLAKQILASGGALITEYQVGSQPYLVNFIKRSRIVTGISDGVLIPEATAKTGTMHTAGFALEQGKPVMVVPGNITSPTSVGCNNLIKTGAIVVTELEDILDALDIKANKQIQLPFAANNEEKLIIDLINDGVREGDELRTLSELDASTFNQTLTMLEISGKIRALGANQWGLK